MKKEKNYIHLSPHVFFFNKKKKPWYDLTTS